MIIINNIDDYDYYDDFASFTIFIIFNCTLLNPDSGFIIK